VLSTGIFTRFKSLAAIIAKKCGLSPEVRSLSDKHTGIFTHACDTTKQKNNGFCYIILGSNKNCQRRFALNMYRYKKELTILS
jgi:hypothetical protein